MTDISVAEVGFGLVILGFIIALAAIILLFFKSTSRRTNTRGGGILLLGPIPIIFGTDKESLRTLMILAIVLMLAVLVIMIIPWLVTR